MMNNPLAYLKVNDGDTRVGRQGYGGDSSDEGAHLLTDLHLGISNQRPQQRMDQRLGDVLLQLVKLSAHKHSNM